MEEDRKAMRKELVAVIEERNVLVVGNEDKRKFKHRNRLPRELVESPSLYAFKIHLVVVLRNMI